MLLSGLASWLFGKKPLDYDKYIKEPTKHLSKGAKRIETSLRDTRMLTRMSDGLITMEEFSPDERYVYNTILEFLNDSYEVLSPDPSYRCWITRDGQTHFIGYFDYERNPVGDIPENEYGEDEYYYDDDTSFKIVWWYRIEFEPFSPSQPRLEVTEFEDITPAFWHVVTDLLDMVTDTLNPLLAA